MTTLIRTAQAILATLDENAIAKEDAAYEAAFEADIARWTAFLEQHGLPSSRRDAITARVEYAALQHIREEGWPETRATLNLLHAGERDGETIMAYGSGAYEVVKAKHAKPGMRVRAWLYSAPQGNWHEIANVVRLGDGSMVRITFADGTARTVKAAYRFFLPTKEIA